MTILINPGSGAIADSGVGWTNTVEQARVRAQRWLETIHEEGIRDVELHPGERYQDGRWRFGFRHTVTGVYVVLEIHGVDDIDAYTKDGHIFGEPRVYWNGSSCSDPKIEDWRAPGFEVVQTFRPVGDDQ